MQKKNSKRFRGSGCKEEIIETEKAGAKAEVDIEGETEREGGAEIGRKRQRRSLPPIFRISF